jgi:ubiquinone/menaquinone biosynthesis C-methylase UbiE
VGREGNFVLSAAKIVTQTGHVYALDVVKEILELIAGKAQDAGFQNVEPVWTDLEMYGAARAVVTGSLDVAVLANTLFQSQKKADMIKECVRMIKPGGRLLVVEWKPVETVFGPPVTDRVTPDAMKELAHTEGLRLTEEFEAGEYHWGQLYER